MGAIRPLRRVRPGIARSRDERFELVRGPGCWQVRSLDTTAASLLLSGGGPAGMLAQTGSHGMAGVDRE
jgi:hypothetical protein